MFTFLSAFSVAKSASAIIPFFQKYWKIIAIVIVILLAYLYWKDLKDTISNQQDHIVQLEKQLTECKTNAVHDMSEKANLENKLTASSEIIANREKSLTGFKKRVSDLQQSLVAADSANKTQHERAISEVNKILVSPVPTDCPSSIDFLIKGIKDLQW